MANQYFPYMKKTANIIAILNHKGGVGKTTTTVNIGAALNRKGYRVLMIDLDPQANLTQSLGLDSDQNAPNIYQALRGMIPGIQTLTKRDGLDIVPSSLDLSAAEMELSNEISRESILSRLVAPLQDKYDYILIDCPPSLGLLTVNALVASTGLIIPVQAEFLATRGMSRIMSIIDMVKTRLNKQLPILGVLLTRYDSRKILNRDIHDTIKDLFQSDVFTTVIRDNVALAEAPAVGEDIFSYQSGSMGAMDYNAVCEEIIEKLK